MFCAHGGLTQAALVHLPGTLTLADKLAAPPPGALDAVGAAYKLFTRLASARIRRVALCDAAVPRGALFIVRAVLRALLIQALCTLVTLKTRAVEHATTVITRVFARTANGQIARAAPFVYEIARVLAAEVVGALATLVENDGYANGVFASDYIAVYAVAPHRVCAAHPRATLAAHADPRVPAPRKAAILGVRHGKQNTRELQAHPLGFTLHNKPAFARAVGPFYFPPLRRDLAPSPTQPWLLPRSHSRMMRFL